MMTSMLFLGFKNLREILKYISAHFLLNHKITATELEKKNTGRIGAVLLNHECGGRICFYVDFDNEIQPKFHALSNTSIIFVAGLDFWPPYKKGVHC